MQDLNFKAPYFNVLDQIDHSAVLLPRLARITRLKHWIEKLWPNGHPSKFIHVAGTSGKGSTARFLETGLAQFGRAGSCTGPHLFDYRERFTLGGVPVTAEEVTRAWEDVVLPLCVEVAGSTPHAIPVYSDIRLLMALTLFDRCKVDWAIYETGHGGRYDQGMALPVEACVLTNVGNDHEDALGKEIWQRATEKAGIARKDVPLFTAARDGLVHTAISQVAAHVGAPLHTLTDKKSSAFLAELKAAVGKLPEKSLLHAAHQRENAALALMTVTLLKPEIDRARMLADIAKLEYAGRFQKLEERLYADVAHNPDKVRALAIEVSERFPNQRLGFVVGLSGQRDGAEVLTPLLDIASEIVVTQPGYKGVPADLLAASLNRDNPRRVPLTVEANPMAAAGLLRQRLNGGLLDVGVLTGSMYMLDEALNPNPYISYLNRNFGWRK